MLCYSKDGLYTSLTTLPSEALQTEALKLFKVKWEQSPAHGLAAAPSPFARVLPGAFLLTMVMLGWRRLVQLGASSWRDLIVHGGI